MILPSTLPSDDSPHLCCTLGRGLCIPQSPSVSYSLWLKYLQEHACYVASNQMPAGCGSVDIPEQQWKRTTYSTPSSCGATLKGFCSAAELRFMSSPADATNAPLWMQGQLPQLLETWWRRSRGGWIHFRPFRRVSKVRFPCYISGAYT